MRWVAILAFVALAACGGGSSSSASKSSSASTHSVNGDLTILGAHNDRVGGCQMQESGYSDISKGTQVTVTNESGTIIGSTSLGEGSSSPRGDGCLWPFTVPDVKNASFYTITVSHRGPLTFSEAQMETMGFTVHASLP